MAVDINEERNGHLLRLKKTATELAAVIISATSLFVTIIAVLFAAFAMFKADLAVHRSVQLENEIRLYEVYIQELQAMMRAEK